MCLICYLFEVTLLVPVALFFVWLAGVALFETGDHSHTHSAEKNHNIETVHKPILSGLASSQPVKKLGQQLKFEKSLVAVMSS